MIGFNLLALASVFAAYSTAYGGFVIRDERTPFGALDRIDISVWNLGLAGDYHPLGRPTTGTAIGGLDFAFTVSDPFKAYFPVQVGAGLNGGDFVDLRNPTDIPNVTTFRIGAVANTIVVLTNPSSDEAIPAGSSPWIGGVDSFRVVAVGLVPVEAYLSGPLLVASIFVDRDAGITFHGLIGGNSGVGEVTIYQIHAVPEPSSTVILCTLLPVRRSRPH
jgi:hypothetical protein